uniref:Uncharacterized protein n=1 Tax=Magallana gigas TaxID=29159 RepID=K1R550_MAGGI
MWDSSVCVDMKLRIVIIAMTIFILHTFAQDDVIKHRKAVFRLHKRYMADLTLPSIIASLSRRNVCPTVDCQYYELMKYGRRKRDLSLLKYEICCDN